MKTEIEIQKAAFDFAPDYEYGKSIEQTDTSDGNEIKFLERVAFVRGALWMRQQPALTEEQMEQEAKRFADTMPDVPAWVYNAHRNGYRNALYDMQSHAKPAVREEVSNEVLDAIAMNILNLPSIRNQDYNPESIKIILRHYVNPKPNNIDNYESRN